MAGAADVREDTARLRWHRPAPATVLSVGWVVLAAFLYLLPSLLHGTSLGSLDILDAWSLTAKPGAQVHNPVSGDQVQDMIPWAVLSWQQVHAGHFPLWNPYSGFGMPLFGNFQSASLSLPTLVSYLAPVHLVFTVQIFVKLLIAGTGVLWLGRRLGLGHLAAALGATVFMLSGSFTGWLGWPMSGTTAWLGWAVGAGLLIVRGDNRRLHAAGLAVVVAFTVYAGHPETTMMVLGSTAVIVAAALVGPLVRRTRDGLAALAYLAAGSVAGLLLSAPLLLPGLQIIDRSSRAGVVGYAKPYRVSVNLLFGTYHGMPTHSYGIFGAGNYNEAACYVGVVAVALAGLTLVLHWRRPEVIGMAVVGTVAFFLAFSTHLARVLDRYPLVKEVQWTRMLLVLDFVLAVLAALGLQALVARWREPVVRRVFAGWAAAAAGVLAAVWAFRSPHLTPHQASIQDHSFVWPVVGAAVMVLCAAALEIASYTADRPGPRAAHVRSGGAGAGAAALAGPATGWLVAAAAAAFLLTATPRLLSSSRTFFPTTPPIAALESQVGTARVGFECRSVLAMPHQGILPEANDVYGVREAAAYDGAVPKSYFTSYYSFLGEPVPGNTGYGQWCPAMPDARVARHYGVAYILTAADDPTPAGTQQVATISGEKLFRVTGAGVITVQADGAPADGAPADGGGALVPAVQRPAPSVLSARFEVSQPSTVYVHVTDFPGWHATLDGHAVGLRTWGVTMMAVPVPAGTHRLVLTYRPALFVLGCWLALAAALFLVILLASRSPVSGTLGRWARRRGRGGSSTSTWTRSTRRWRRTTTPPSPDGP